MEDRGKIILNNGLKLKIETKYNFYLGAEQKQISDSLGRIEERLQSLEDASEKGMGQVRAT